MIKKNWRDFEPFLAHDAGVDWRIFNNKHEKFREEQEQEGGYFPEKAVMDVIRFVSLAHLNPGKCYHAHAHDDHEEIYYIISGKGKMIVDDEESDIMDGDCIYIPLNSVHQIVNDGDQIIEFLAFAGNVE